MDSRTCDVRVFHTRNHDVSDRNARQEVPCIFMTIKTRPEDIAETIKTQNIDVNCKDKNGQHVLFYAVQYLKGPTFNQLLTHIDNPNSLISTCGKPALHHAVRHNVAAILSLLSAGCDINTPDVVHEDTPLHVACFYGNLHAIILLVQGGAAVNCHNRVGQTPLDKLLSLCDQPARNSSAKSRLLTAHTLAHMGFKVNPKAQGQRHGTRERILHAFSKVQRCSQCSTLQHICRLAVRQLLPPLHVKSALTSLHIAHSLMDFLLFQPIALDHHITCCHGIKLGH